MSLRRARLSLLAAVGLASALLVFELPVSELLSQRGQLSNVSAQLARVDSRNAALGRDIASLRENATIAAIAHADYGLVARGQEALAILPTSGGAASSGPSALSVGPVSSADLVVPSADALGSSGSGSSPVSADGSSVTGSVWSRALDRLEFWRWVF